MISSIFLCQTVLCLLVPPVIKYQQNHEYQKPKFLPSHKRTLLQVSYIHTVDPETLNSQRRAIIGNFHFAAIKPVIKWHAIGTEDEQEYYDNQVVNKNSNHFIDDASKNWNYRQQGNVNLLGHKNIIKIQPSQRSISLSESILDSLTAYNDAIKYSQTGSAVYMVNVNQPIDDNSISSSHVLNDRQQQKITNWKHSFIAPTPTIFLLTQPLRIWGEGSESKFPPILEFFVQRIQKYFSIYKYEDLSRPGLETQYLQENPEVLRVHDLNKNKTENTIFTISQNGNVTNYTKDNLALNDVAEQSALADNSTVVPVNRDNKAAAKETTTEIFPGYILIGEDDNEDFDK